jgi:hypothetical protein
MNSVELRTFTKQFGPPVCPERKGSFGAAGDTDGAARWAPSIGSSRHESTELAVEPARLMYSFFAKDTAPGVISETEGVRFRVVRIDLTLICAYGFRQAVRSI